ncbi:MAG TPA: hypothetical protein VN132_12400, partial [Bdellovibrio sp.]|nr:hypothetical protein [Bdellovibrio sp.]
MKWGRLGLAMITLVQFQTVQVYGETTHQKVESIDSSLFPIETQPVTGTPIDDLFPTQPHITPGDGSNGNGTGKTQTGNQQKPTNGNTTTGGTTTNGNGSMKTADTTFKCSLFENTDFKDVLSAVNSLNQAVGSPSCGGTSINVQGIQDNNKKIADAVKALNGFLENPETVQPENAAAIVNNVDIAVRAANALATTFGSSDLMNKNCRDQMNGGQVALALNDIINGLTPYALMAATMTGGTAAVPFIVGGSVITGALSSMNKIVTENSTKINDAQVRRAIVENTCQFIRLDQKYKFLIKNRDEQVSKISKEITASQNLFSQKVDGLSKKTSGLVNRRNALSDTSSSLDKKLSAAVNQLAMDKAFVVGTTDEIKICQIGLQLASLSQDQSSYVATMLNSVDEAMLAYGSSNIAEARALKFSGQIALNSLNQMASQQFTMNSDFSGCAKAAKSFVETVEQSGALAKRIVKVAQDNVDKELKS